MRKARILTLEEIFHDRLGAHIYEENLETGEVKLLIKVGSEGVWMYENCLENGHQFTTTFEITTTFDSGGRRFWRGFPSKNVRFCNKT